MKRLGTIQFVQVQRNPLKEDTGSGRVYDPAPVMRVDDLQLTPEGVMGITRNGETIVDVHHRQHPGSRNRKNTNGISLNFLANYDRIRSRFSRSETEIGTGVAGENLVIASNADFDADEIGSRLAIKTRDGQWIYLDDVMVIAPCAEFSTYIAGRPLEAPQMRDTLQFLSDGTRGFYATLSDHEANPIIRAGDEVYAV
jgi:hypothetical protein